MLPSKILSTQSDHITITKRLEVSGATLRNTIHVMRNKQRDIINNGTPDIMLVDVDPFLDHTGCDGFGRTLGSRYLWAEVIIRQFLVMSVGSFAKQWTRTIGWTNGTQPWIKWKISRLNVVVPHKCMTW